ncbi:uncharacterized protein LOC128325939 [Hemicordylus capensis]|uniref:uncharacterized protein LOC128325939 n=1 Tax=Hemicordylus capensis TaxID=884348 RepID=UPI002302FA84|nr:uncharacterized protein LOC128325939 [Hemicordylus capensis]
MGGMHEAEAVAACRFRAGRMRQGGSLLRPSQLHEPLVGGVFVRRGCRVHGDTGREPVGERQPEPSHTLLDTEQVTAAAPQPRAPHSILHAASSARLPALLPGWRRHPTYQQPGGGCSSAAFTCRTAEEAGGGLSLLLQAICSAPRPVPTPAVTLDPPPGGSKLATSLFDWCRALPIRRVFSPPSMEVRSLSASPTAATAEEVVCACTPGSLARTSGVVSWRTELVMPLTVVWTSDRLVLFFLCAVLEGRGVLMPARKAKARVGDRYIAINRWFSLQ